MDENGNNVGGGDFFVDADGDGVFNYSELQLPEGYELVTAGDAFVSQGSFTVTVKKTVSSSIVKVIFVDENGNNVGGGDYFVDADGDGIFNYSELTLPAGYELVQSGDEFVGADTYTVKVQKIVDGTMINVVFVDEHGNSLGGGDYIVDTDNDGIFNYSELPVPEGYELTVSGDAFVKDFENGTRFLTVEKIAEGTIINVIYEDENGNNVGGGDFIVDKDGDGIANYSELELPVGYKLNVSGDFFVADYAGTSRIS